MPCGVRTVVERVFAWAALGARTASSAARMRTGRRIDGVTLLAARRQERDRDRRAGLALRRAYAPAGLDGILGRADAVAERGGEDVEVGGEGKAPKERFGCAV